MFSSTLIIGGAFIPTFHPHGGGWRYLRADGHTYAFAIGGATILAMTLTPTLAALVLGRRQRPLGTPDRLHAYTVRRAATTMVAATLTVESSAFMRAVDPCTAAVPLRARAQEGHLAVGLGVGPSCWRCALTQGTSGASSCPSSRRATSGSATMLPTSISLEC